jgi:DNA-binding NarL/FixJ family response regulator
MGTDAAGSVIRVLLVDDHAVVRNGYRRLFDAEPGLLVVGEAARADEANEVMLRTQPDVALVDLSLRGSSGFEAIRGMLARRKHCEPLDVIDGIRKVATGKRVFSPEVAQIIACESAAGDGALQHLTPREFEVLRMLVRGDSSQAIATSMQLSPKTILNYLSLIRQKLGVDNDFKLLHLAARHGLVTWQPVR